MEFNQEILEEIQTVHVALHFEDFCYEEERRDGGAFAGACVFNWVLFLKMKMIQLEKEISVRQRRHMSSGRMVLGRRGDSFYP